MQFKTLPLVLLAGLVAAVPADSDRDSWEPSPVSSAAPSGRSNWSPASSGLHPRPGAKACPARSHRGSHPSPSAAQSSHSSGWAPGLHSGSGASGGWQPQQGGAAQATLLPTMHPSQDKSDLDHIRPGNSHDQYYMPGGSSFDQEHQFGWLKSDFQDNAIMLDYSDLYTYHYDASSGSLSVDFNDEDAFNLAKGLWHSGMILIFYDGSCGPAMNCYLVCGQLSFDASSQTCSISTTTAKYEDIYSEFQFQWGRWRPGNQPYPSQSTQSWYSSSATASTTTSSGSGSTIGPGSTTSTGTATTTTGTPSATPNLSFGFNSSSIDCTAPADTVYGLPTACLGQYFDDDLDESYGLVDLDAALFSQFAGQITDLFYDQEGTLDSGDISDDDDADDGTLGRRSLKKRLFGFDIPNPITYVLEALPPVSGLNTPYDIPIVKQQIPLNIPSERKTVPSPWGDQVLIASFADQSSGGTLSGKLNLFCVNCGVSGSADISGNLGVSASRGINYIKAQLDVNVGIGIKLGLDAEVTYQNKITQKLFTLPLSPFTIGVASIGPVLNVGAEVDLNLQAKGQILAGGTYSITGATAMVEVTTQQRSASGWSPVFEPTFEAQGEIAASAELGLPIEVLLGISALTYSAGVSLIERPAIIAKAQASATANLNGAGFVSVDGCTGISSGISFKNNLYARVSAPGIYSGDFPIDEYPEKALVNNCIQLPAAPSSSTTEDSSQPTATDGGDGTGDNSPAEKRSISQPLYPRQSNGTIINTTAQTLANATTNTTAFVVPSSNDLSYNRTDGYYVTSFTDNTGAYQVYSCSDNNLYVFRSDESNVLPSDCGATFIFGIDEQHGFVGVADSYSDIFVWYPDEMAAVGVSRIRAVDIESIPSKSQEIVFVLGDTSSGSSVDVPVYYPLSNTGETFYPVVCKYAPSSGIYNKLFLVKDPVQGLQTLKQQNIKYSITGGDIESCYLMPLIDGAGYGAAYGDGGLYVYDNDDDDFDDDSI